VKERDVMEQATRKSNGVLWWILLALSASMGATAVWEFYQLVKSLWHPPPSFTTFGCSAAAAAVSFLVLYGWEKHRGIS
jgi:hypothetical protein